ncbi:MAG TPA: hydrogenase formation protein HypD [Pseudomonadota bacterium]|nr:hydrogenase formation protein HypD [Pseudomonadota bacterium]
MAYIDEYRDAALARRYADRIAKLVTRPWKIMEACGGQTHSIVKYGIDQMLPAGVELIHGPGCPVCVTPMSTIDAAIRLAGRPEVILCSFGDMLRVPGTRADLQTVKAERGDVRIVYSPLDALKVAVENPTRQVVFFAVGFETTAPANAMAAFRAKQLGLANFSMLVSQVLVPPALAAILSSGPHRIDGFLAPGHVCTIVGFGQYEPLCHQHRVPIVVTGFEPGDILQGLAMCIEQLEAGRAEVENQYTRSVHREGNLAAQKMIGEVFEIAPKVWRGLGTIAHSGLQLAAPYRFLDAEQRFALGPESPEEKTGCISGQILQGLKKPPECPQFARGCRPERPLGATMVSSEGACAAYYRYRRPPTTPKVEQRHG